MTTALEGGERSASRPVRSLPPGKTRYPLYRRLGEPQGRSGQARKISPPPGFDPRTFQPLASRYNDWAIPARNIMCTSRKIQVSEHRVAHYAAAARTFFFFHYRHSFKRSGGRINFLCFWLKFWRSYIKSDVAGSSETSVLFANLHVVKYLNITFLRTCRFLWVFSFHESEFVVNWNSLII